MLLFLFVKSRWVFTEPVLDRFIVCVNTATEIETNIKQLWKDLCTWRDDVDLILALFINHWWIEMYVDKRKENYR